MPTRREHAVTIDVALATSRQPERRLAEAEVGVFTLLALFTASGHANLTPAAYAAFGYSIARLVLFSSADGEPPRHLLVPIAAFAGLTLHALRTGTAELGR